MGSEMCIRDSPKSDCDDYIGSLIIAFDYEGTVVAAKEYGRYNDDHLRPMILKLSPNQDYLYFGGGFRV